MKVAISPSIARVEPLTSTRAIRGPFDYRLRPDQPGVRVGSLLQVPFGRQRMLGVVVGLTYQSEVAEDRLAEPDRVLSAQLPCDLVELARWMASEYCSTFARALGLVLPPGVSAGVCTRRVLVAELADAGSTALAGGAELTEKQRGLLLHLDRHGATPAAKLGTAALRRLERRGLVTICARRERRAPVITALEPAQARKPALTADQQRALAEVLDAMRPPARSEPVLLHGVTGSGKTEVYIHAVQAALERGGGAIVMVPEIALTPQVVGRFVARFGDVVAVLHSGLSAGERHDEWLRLRSGEARVCVGPRSAVFAPLERIGLIVIDEEHDSSYKHEGDPRYDARTVALHRARRHRALVLEGSATPRPESALCSMRIRLPHRIDARPLPPVRVLDMRGNHHPLHPVTRMALADCRRERHKAIVLMNRRGWSNFLSCRDCGVVWTCPNCEVALVLHRTRGHVACHHCGHRERVTDRCQACGSVALARHGAGTERLEQELREAIGERDFPVFRLDGDSIAERGRLANTLNAFRAADAGILLGTQMVAKGHDFPDVTLGVVIDADQTLRFPDFRAEERTFALITQLAGRTGRGEHGGNVLVQTLSPSARAIGFAARHDADGFLPDELDRRRALRYPPFGSLIRVVCSSQHPHLAELATRALADRITALAEQANPRAWALLGPAPLFRLRSKNRSQLLIKAQERDAAIDAVGLAVREVALPRGVNVSVDVDPQ